MSFSFSFLGVPKSHQLVSGRNEASALYVHKLCGAIPPDWSLMMILPGELAHC